MNKMFHECKDVEIEQDIIIVYMPNIPGWFLWFDYPGDFNCKINYCPFCGKQLEIE